MTTNVSVQNERLDRLFSGVMALCAILVLAIPVGIANMFLGYVMGESPCTLCWWERMGMITFGVLSLLIVRYGPKLRYVGLMLAVAAYGLFMTIRHSSMCAATSEMDYGFGTAILGAHTYVWGVFVYWMVGLVLGCILMYFSRSPEFAELMKGKRPGKLNGFTATAFGLCLVVILSNAFQAFFQNGIPPFSGQGDPVRFTMDLSTASQRWTTTVWSRIGNGFSLAGAWKIDDSFIPGETEPDDFAFDTRVESGAIENVKPAPAVIGETPLAFEAKGFRGAGVAAGLTWVPGADEWVVASTKGAVYYTDASMSKVVRKGVLDLVNGSDMPYTVDVSWVGDKAILTGRNKIIWASAPRPEGKTVDAFKEWSIFVETTGNIDTPWDRKRKSVRTIRAKMNWVGAIAAAPDAKSFFMTTVPSKQKQKTILVKVDAADQILSAETPLRAGEGLKLKDGRGLDEYYITGLTAWGDKLLAFSRQYSTLLTIDPATGAVIDAHAMPVREALHSMAVKGDELVMLDRKDGRDVVVRFDLKSL